MKTNRYIPLITAILCGALFLVSLIPIAMVAPVVRSTGDDLNYSAAVHHAIMNGEGIAGVMQSVIRTARGTWYSWQGTWSSVALFSLQPGIWGNQWYPLTIVIAVICIVAGTWYFLHTILRLMGVRRIGRWSIVALVGILLIQYMPNVKCGIFWWTSVAHYTIAYGMAMMCMGWSLRWLETGRIRYFIGMLVGMSYLGGAGYPEVVLSAAWFFLVILIVGSGIFCVPESMTVESMPFHEGQVHAARQIVAHHTLRIRTLHLLLPFVLEMIGFAVSAAAPGNKHRGGEEFGFSIERIATTLPGCVSDGIVGIAQDMVRVRLYLPLLAILMILVYVYYRPALARVSMRHPVLWALAGVIIICIIRAPERYAQTEVSGGVPDSYWMVTLTMMTVMAAGLAIWVRDVIGDRMSKDGQSCWLQQESTALIVVIMFLGLCLIGYRHLVGGSADYICVNYIRSGEMADYHEQMEEWLDLLEDPSLESVVLPMMNDQQGPIMMMVPLETDGNFSNSVYERYYDKISVICVPREEYSSDMNGR